MHGPEPLPWGYALQNDRKNDKTKMSGVHHLMTLHKATIIPPYTTEHPLFCTHLYWPP